MNREHPRYAHEAAVTLYEGDRVYQGRSSNVSRGGLCATVTEPMPVGSALDIDLTLVFEDDLTSEPLRLPARVVWCTHLDDGHQLGLAFHSLDAERVEYLTMFLRYLEDGSADAAKPRDLSIDDRFA
ncbi:MAG TPA: PilZ domain-containing protein [Kofleriaceae bacterium]